MNTKQPKKRKQRSPFYCKIFRDKSRNKQWGVITITRSGTRPERTREFFMRKSEAKAALRTAEATHLTEGLSSVEISTALRVEAKKAAEILAGKGTLIEAAEYFIKHAHPTGGEMKLSEVVKQYCAWQEADGASESYLTDLTWRLDRLARKLPASIKLPEVTWPVLSKYLSQLALKPGGRENEIRNIRPMFNWALDAKLIATNPIPSQALFTRKKDRSKIKPIRILSLHEIDLLLEHAGDFLPHLVFGLFCGARPDETKGLEWKDVNWAQKRVTINNHNSAMHDRRTVPIPDNALLWLTPYREMTGLVSPPKQYLARLHKAAKPLNLTRWPVDCIRHRFASYWLAKHDDESRLKSIMGHHWASQMLRKHYLDRGITAEQAEVYWNLAPKSPANVIHLAAKRLKSGA